MVYNPEKHHRHSIRLTGYDYSRSGAYFVTICTLNRANFFGCNAWALNEFGEIASRLWLEVPGHFDGIELDEFVIMPNHIHGIVVINSFVNPNEQAGIPAVKKRPYQTIPVVIGSFKSAVTREINQVSPTGFFRWQKFYYDHIIRNDKSLQNIRSYIIYNPSNWQSDFENIINNPTSQNHSETMKKNYDQLFI
jgi:putative transposase